MSGEGKAKKLEYIERVKSLLSEYPRVILVGVDNIGSSHMQRIRLDLRGKGILLMGKNTLMRKAIRDSSEEHPEWMELLQCITGNIGMVFTELELTEIKPLLLASVVPASAKAGAVAPQTVTVDAQVTSLEPTKTTFFAALDIATKITRGCVEILKSVTVAKVGERVGSSEAALLQMLGIKPFSYGLILKFCYEDGFAFPANLLDKNQDDLVASFSQCISNIAALSLGIGYPTLPAFPHAVMNAYKNLLAVCLATDYEFERCAELKDKILNPEKYASAVVEEKKEEVKEEVKEEEEEEEESDGAGLMDFF